MEPCAKNESRLNQIQEYIRRIPSLSTTVTKVIEICNDPNVSPNDLGRVISLDPVLTGKVLKLINSAYYALSNQVTSVTRAIIMLGLNTVKNLALSTAVLGSVAGKGSLKGLSMDDFWMHSLCVGVTSKSLASITGVPVIDREEYFVTGLLHDLGKLPINQVFADEYEQALLSSKNNRIALQKAEQDVIGIDHGMVGGMIGQKWQLNKPIIDSMRYHHSLEEVGEENQRLMTIIAAANIHANINSIGSSGNLYPEQHLLNSLLEQVGVTLSKLSSLHESILTDIEKAKVFLQVSQKD